MAKDKPSTYKILGSPTAVNWTVIGEEDGSATSAVNKFLTDHPDDTHGPYYVAVPARSWRPGKAEQATKTVTKFTQLALAAPPAAAGDPS